ncbi:hypothetical protein RJT34_24974 [Clitoria ternatea]|uniref:PPPDE domain-containing protein n=1 Tax=Clitoria ternatea TaxID=43366 RepID=A0AAN9FVT2_CLITE
MVLRINKIFKDAIGIGGIFHSAVQVYDYGEDEWSYGFCEEGSGVFSCPSSKNTMFRHRTTLFLGVTELDIQKVNEILRELSDEWHGYLYDPLSKNCNHFSDEFLSRLGVPKLPGWVNRFANAGDAALEMALNTECYLHKVKTEIVSASKSALKFFSGAGSATNDTKTGIESPSNGGSHRVHTSWFKTLASSGEKQCNNSSKNEVQDEVEPQQQTQQNMECNATTKLA